MFEGKSSKSLNFLEARLWGEQRNKSGIPSAAITHSFEQ